MHTKLRNRRAAFNSAARNLQRNGIEFKTNNNSTSDGAKKFENSKKNKNKTINNTKNIENNVKLPKNLTDWFYKPTAPLLSNVLLKQRIYVTYKNCIVLYVGTK